MDPGTAANITEVAFAVIVAALLVYSIRKRKTQAAPNQKLKTVVALIITGMLVILLVAIRGCMDV